MNSSLLALIKRNMKIFYRTKGNIIFASLSVVILLVLHLIIFRDMFTDSFVEIMKAFPFEVERIKLSYIVDSSMFAAILPIGAITISLVALGLMVSDRETNALSDFMVSPINRNSLLASYLISSFIVGFAILLCFIAVFEVVFLLVYGISMSFAQLAAILAVTILALVFGNVFMLLIITFVKSQQSLGAVGTIVGTLLGFLSGAYIPVGQFGEAIANVFSILPFMQITVAMRQAFFVEFESVVGFSFDTISGELTKEMGYELFLFGEKISTGAVAAMASLTTIVLFAIVVLRFKKMKKAE